MSKYKLTIKLHAHTQIVHKMR